MDMGDGMKRGTFRTYTVFVDTHDVIVKNLTIENSAGPGTCLLYTSNHYRRFGYSGKKNPSGSYEEKRI